MKVLITGAAGFLGSHLMLHHLRNRDIVVGIDNYCSSKRDSKHVGEINLLTQSVGFEGMLIEGNITSERSLESCLYVANQLLGNDKFDLIYNFACPASPPVYQSMPIETMMTCVLGTRNMLDIAERNNSVLVHASTSEVYGDPEVSPQPESYRGCVNSYGPRACYDEGKRAAEALCFDYYKKGVDARLVRIFNTYGPHMDPNDGRVVTNFIRQALQGEQLTIYGDGNQTRSICYVDDLIRGITLLAKLEKNPLIPINLGNPVEMSVSDIAALVLRAIGVNEQEINDESRLLFEKLPIDDPMQRRPNIANAQWHLKWNPTVSPKDGIKQTIAYFKDVLQVT